MEEKLIVVIEGPSGVGKDSVIAGLIKLSPEKYAKIVSFSTRKMREGESQGKPYHFVTNEEFNKLLEQGDVFEYTERYKGEYRGMSKKYIEEATKNGKVVGLKDCDEIGLAALKKIYGDRVFSIFVTAPKHKIKKRLIKRGDSEEDVKKRFADYDDKVKKKKLYHKVVANHNLDKTIKKVDKLIDKHTKKIHG